MWLKALSIIGLLLQVFFQVMQSLSQAKERDAGKLEQNMENQKIIEDNVDEANKVRDGSNQLDDSLLLKPSDRSAGGVPGLSTDIRGESGGSIETKSINGSGKNQSPQSYMGKQLSPGDFKLPKRQVNKVFIHCSASDRPEDDNVKTINGWHIARGWIGIGYNFYIDKQGRILTGRDIELIPAAQHGHNTGSIAICCGGKNFFSAAQFFSLQKFCKKIAEIFSEAGVEITFHGHCEVSSKTCPDFDYKTILSLDENGRPS